MSEKKIRITKAQRYEDIKALLEGRPVTSGTTLPIALEFIDHEMDLLAKKNTSGEKKLTKTQEENEVLKGHILTFLSDLPANCAGKTCTEIFKEVPQFADFSPNKVSSLMGQLYRANLVTYDTDKKGKKLFRAA